MRRSREGRSKVTEKRPWIPPFPANKSIPLPLPPLTRFRLPACEKKKLYSLLICF